MSRRDYDVGYGKPPMATRFKPGQSGNPRGRPKRIPTLAECVEREARRTIVATEDGTVRRMSKRDALAKRLMQQALKGDARATQQVIQLLALRQATDEAGHVTHDAERAGDEAVLQGLLQRLGHFGSPAAPAPAADQIELPPLPSSTTAPEAS